MRRLLPVVEYFLEQRYIQILESRQALSHAVEAGLEALVKAGEREVAAATRTISTAETAASKKAVADILKVPVYHPLVVSGTKAAEKELARAAQEQLEKVAKDALAKGLGEDETVSHIVSTLKLTDDRAIQQAIDTVQSVKSAQGSRKDIIPYEFPEIKPSKGDYTKKPPELEPPSAKEPSGKTRLELEPPSAKEPSGKTRLELEPPRVDKPIVKPEPKLEPKLREPPIYPPVRRIPRLPRFIPPIIPNMGEPFDVDTSYSAFDERGRITPADVYLGTEALGRAAKAFRII